jgi:hypothetical protein
MARRQYISRNFLLLVGLVSIWVFLFTGVSVQHLEHQGDESSLTEIPNLVADLCGPQLWSFETFFFDHKYFLQPNITQELPHHGQIFYLSPDVQCTSFPSPLSNSYGPKMEQLSSSSVEIGQSSAVTNC